MAHRVVSPNEMLQAAKDYMLDGREPEDRDDWQLIFNFFAANIASGSAVAACKLLAALYDAPLTTEEIEYIVAFQQAQSN